MNMTREQIESILQSEESETIERKSGFDAREIRKALSALFRAFVNYQATWMGEVAWRGKEKFIFTVPFSGLIHRGEVSCRSLPAESRRAHGSSS